jgi:hypothetical protein
MIVSNVYEVVIVYVIHCPFCDCYIALDDLPEKGRPIICLNPRCRKVFEEGGFWDD